MNERVNEAIMVQFSEEFSIMMAKLQIHRPSLYLKAFNLDMEFIMGHWNETETRGRNADRERFCILIAAESEQKRKS